MYFLVGCLCVCGALVMSYICGHIYQDLIITTHYYILFDHFNNS